MAQLATANTIDRKSVAWYDLQNNMVKLVLLGGNSVGNKKWIETMAESLKDHFGQIYVHYYHHWDTGEEWIDSEHELATLAKVVAKMDQYVILSRSAGTLLALKGIHEGKLHPKKCIFVGIAIKWAQHLAVPVEKWLKNYSVPTLLIQKSHDPAISHADLEKFLIDHEVTNYKLIEVPGDDHYYGDTEEIDKLVLDYCNGLTAKV